MTPSNDWMHFYIDGLTSKVVANSGIPTDRFHLGKIILQSLKDDLEFVAQIDGYTGEVETNGSVLRRSVQCAAWFRNLGLQHGDVITLMSPNTVDLVIPFYAALYLGIGIAPIDMSLNIVELQNTFEVNRPKIVFCQSEKENLVQEALYNVALKSRVVTFDMGQNGSDFSNQLAMYENVTEVDNFRPSDFDPEETLAVLVPTSGTTGFPKSAILTHKSLAIAAPYVWCSHTKFPSPVPSVLIVAQLQWLTTVLNFIMSPYIKYTRIMSSLPATQEHTYELITKYRPSFMITSPTFMTTLMKPGDREKCDFTCFKLIYLGGSAVHADLITSFKEISPETEVVDMYGMTELSSVAFNGRGAPPGSSGQRIGCLQYRLINIATEEEILEPNVPGELWLKGPGVFKGYYNNPKATTEVFTEDGWFRTGDMFQRDQSWNYYFVERIKLLLKYRNYQISPLEVEDVIRKHPAVLDVAVTGIPHAEYGDLPVACVVRRPGGKVTAEEIKDIVLSSLSDTKQLRGGVIFLNELPLMPSTKINRQKLKKIVLAMANQ